jgi:hypothetical protein
MAGITMSPQLRESPETANFQERVDRVCASTEKFVTRISQATRRM